MIISERIFELMKEQKISQREFSKRTGIAQSTICDWKRKKTNPASDKLMVICEVLQVLPYQLLTGMESGEEGKSGYFMIDKSGSDFQLLEQFHRLSEDDRIRLLGHLRHLLNEPGEAPEQPVSEQSHTEQTCRNSQSQKKKPQKRQTVSAPGRAEQDLSDTRISANANAYENDICAQYKKEINVNTESANTENASTENVDAESTNAKNVSTESTNAKNVSTESANAKNVSAESANAKNVSTESVNTKNANTESVNTENLNKDKRNAKKMDGKSIETRNVNTEGTAKNVRHARRQLPTELL